MDRSLHVASNPSEDLFDRRADTARLGNNAGQSNSESIDSSHPYPSHVNSFGLIIKPTKGKGRGVFATRPISAGTVMDIAPVLFFGRDEYVNYAKHTIVDDYAFVWGDGRMALALGLGSILNHSTERPNVSYTKDKKNDVIRFTTTKPIAPGEELFIYYGTNLWFPEAGSELSDTTSQPKSNISGVVNQDLTQEDTWQSLPPNEDDLRPLNSASGSNGYSSLASTSEGLAEQNKAIARQNRGKVITSAYATRQAAATSSTSTTNIPSKVTPDSTLEYNEQAIIPAEEVPLERFKFMDEEDAESDDNPIKTIQVWAVNIQDMSKIGPMLEYLKINAEAFDMDALKHLKRVRRVHDPETKSTIMSFAICPLRSPPSPPPPPFPTSLATFHSDPFVVSVPATPATSPVQLERKSQLWPIAYFPTLEKGKKEKEWTRDELEWVKMGLKTCLTEAERVKSKGGGHGELPIAAYVSPAFHNTETMTAGNTTTLPETETEIAEPPPASSSWIAHDTRQSTSHPLHHACMNLIRHVAETQATNTSSSPTYLLTSQTLFTTHEPCIMCCMALLHSRVKDVFYVFPMRLTGGLGGGMSTDTTATVKGGEAGGGGLGVVRESVPGLKGVNHRYGIWRWTGNLSALSVEQEQECDLRVDDEVDV
ncbi:hypothetical protein FRB97_005908 [Tulasnella sp. 331]|nr:hypothetical protein FRB97_005908 [Tulasnella sp. 331]